MTILYEGKFMECEVIGSYGTFNNPVVSLNGHEQVLSLYFYDPDSLLCVEEVCESRSCDYCEGNYSSCRWGKYKDYPMCYGI